MSNEVQQFITAIEEAEQLLAGYPCANQVDNAKSLSFALSKHLTQELFEKWSEFCPPELQSEYPIRLIQHMSCTGGTLISKCLAAMPNVALLSEVNPLSRLVLSYEPRFAPTNLVYLATLGRFPHVDKLSEKLFKAEIDIISEHLKPLGKHLVIREHSHSDFLVGESPVGVSTIKKILNNHVSVLSVVTVRHPVDSYLSLLNNQWIHFTPRTFDEYCRRYLLFIRQNIGVPVFKYEDFVEAPDVEMKRICEKLRLPFNEDYEYLFDLNVLSGDSGRTSNTIIKRGRRSYGESFHKELNESTHYLQLCERLAYEPSIEFPGNKDTGSCLNR